MQNILAHKTLALILAPLVVGMALAAVVVSGSDSTQSGDTGAREALERRNQNLERTLSKAAESRRNLQAHVQALHQELDDIRLGRRKAEQEAQLWQASYADLSDQFAALAAISTAAEEEIQTQPASFVLPSQRVEGGEAAVVGPPTPSSALYVR